jgi:TonB-dependent starch-binding outer membrane protein SusC
MKPFILLCTLLCFFTGAGCQTINLQGLVISEDGHPVPGASIYIKGSNRYTLSDSAGRFVLPAVKTTDTLTITAVGFHTAEEPVHPRGRLTIILRRKPAYLDEALVIAYGRTTRRLSTGSISRVTAEDIGRQPLSNPLAAPQGRVPGLQINQSNGLPGTNITVNIRGLNSLRQGSQPLFIVDGVPFMLNSGGLAQASPLNNSPFNTISPADIESIEVLKDADAVAIYGSQGANGVLLITTKKGKAGKTSLSLSCYTGIAQVPRSAGLLDTKQYLQMRREAFANDGIQPTLSLAPDLLLWDTSAYTSWQQLLIGGNAVTSDVQAALSGGNNLTSFVFSAAYYAESTVFPGNNPYRRASSRLRVTTASADKKFTADVGAFYSTDNKGLPLIDLTSAIYLPPNAPALYDSAGNLAWAQGIDNPLAYLLRSYKSVNSNFTANTLLQYRLLPSLTVKASLGYNTLSVSEEARVPIRSQRPSATATGTSQWANGSVKGWIIEPHFEYSFSHGKNNWLLVGGSSWQQRTQAGNNITGTRYSNDDLLGTVQAAGTVTVADSYSRYRYMAVFGRLTYNYSRKYIGNINVRRDGSSRFGPGNRFSTFASAAAAWVFSEEAWLQNNRFLSFGKLRGSYGVTGNDQVGDYQYLDAWTVATANQYNGSPGLLPVRLLNANYQWEKNRKLELALELGFVNNRFMMTAAYYRNRSSNQLVSYRLPNTTGFSSILKNLDALVENSGFELDFSSENFRSKNFTWSSGFNISFPLTKLLSYPGLETSTDKYNFAIGHPLRVWYAFTYTGVDPSTGLYRFADLDSNGFVSSPADLALSGSFGPRFTGGLQNKFSWKNFDLDIFFYFIKQTGRSYLTTLAAVPGALSNQPAFVMDRWQKQGQSAIVQRFTATAASPASAAYNLYRNSSAVPEDASFLRLANVYISYRLPQHWAHKIKCSDAKFFMQGRNLFTITGYKGPDPETQSFTTLPLLRTYAAGFRFNF